MLISNRIILIVMLFVVTSITHANPAIDHQALIDKANNAFQKGDYKLAGIYYRKVLKNDAVNAVVLLNVAKCEEVLGDVKQAMDYAIKAKQAEPTYTEAYLILGRLYGRQNDWVRARIAYQTAAVLEPKNSKAQFGLANAITQLDDMDAAKQHLDRYFKLENQDVTVEIQSTQPN